MTKLATITGQLQHRLADGDNDGTYAPLSYDQRAHEVTATLSKGSPVKRLYGTEVLRISPQAIDLSRIDEGGIPLLDHHRQDGIDAILGKLTESWISNGALMGRIKFAQTKRGKIAEGMVARGEISGISAGYRVDQWRVTDADGDEVDENNIRWDDDLTFTATRWQLFEASLVGVPADSAAAVRSLGGNDATHNARVRMQVRANIVTRNARVLK